MVSHRRVTQSGLARSTRATVLSAALATAAAGLGAAPAGAEPRDTAVTARAKVDGLYAQAERATQLYDQADERAGRLRREVTDAQDGVARSQEHINQMRGALGALAGAQYRAGAIDPTLALLLSSDPDSYLDKAVALEQIGDYRAGQLHRFQQARRRLVQQRADADHKLAELRQSRTEVARHKRTVEDKLARARSLLEALPSAQRARYDEVSRSDDRDEMPALGVLPTSGRAAAAVLAARSAVGRPYVWGANGPSGFDCSGLMQWAYAHAGVALPRTSQEQRYAGQRIPLSQARPGDLVVYRSDASHVAMYVGNGQVVHAPHPGATVRYDPVGMMPVSSVTRV
ncbi:NlpC/P60 family protein [Streptomyces sp. NBC_01267]|uniref:C40 family peptidase n=1 Tax=unclassified Streptomyces TaxID=2593676 RepID=UPI0020259FDE|nr:MULTISPECIES: C40 family peptidase [unclassified Streptomyces]MCX4551586.1 NlpC/P60 family protein [Streptomyces sp. NBC_01500]WSC22969.1 NlpC/P60 family protein [Streptomyces sp. NBC_01766]WSV56880.1 NlpC/P60 family protein [Streptomyces sp. NBC_01014]